jgi:glutamyl-tRNA synthetase
MTVRTRFAPSPSGYLHIGGVRTALFNWLLARQAGGQFILRIDDTDAKRNVSEALAPILDGFRWLGIEWDEGPEVDGPYAPYYQSQRLAQYQEAAATLLDNGSAYRDYSRPEEMQAEREAAEKQNSEFIYSRRWMAETPDDSQRFEREGRSFVVRLKMPREGNCDFRDLIRGNVSFQWNRETDHVIQRADGTCLYHLASVVDDHDFRITHVVRAVEHLSNTPRQIFIAQSLGHQLPSFAHLPFVAEPGSRNKLSKRKIEQYVKNADFKKLYEHGRDIAARIGKTISPESFNPVLIDFYKTVGFLPDAVVNYLLLLGWSLDDKTEIFDRQQMIEHFSLDRVVHAEASFDPAKLTSFQHRYMNQLPIARKIEMAFPYLVSAGLVAMDAENDAATHKYVAQVVEAAHERLTVAGDILQFDDFFVADEELLYDETGFRKRIVEQEDAARLLGDFRDLLAKTTNWDAANLEVVLKQFCASMNVKVGQVIHALRIAVTGKTTGFGMFDTLSILGQEKSINRINRALESAKR